MSFDMRINLDSLMSQFSVWHLKCTKKTVEVGLSYVNKLQELFVMNMFLFT